MVNAFLSKLMDISSKDKNVLYLSADNGTTYDAIYKKNFADQFIEFGISEENMVASAAGLSTCGKIPFIYTNSTFLAYRAFEFLRDDICYQNANVKLVGSGVGLSISELGPTHHATEDISVLRSLPNLKIFSPATPFQAISCVQKAYEHNGPVYIRLGMIGEKEFFDEGYDVNDKNDGMTKGDDCIIYVTGSIIEEVIEANTFLKKDNINARIINVCNIKPCNFDELIDYNKDKVFIVEEHNTIGGLGSIVSDYITKNGLHKKLIKIGLNDEFDKGYGDIKMLRKVNFLDSISIYKKIKKELLNIE